MQYISPFSLLQDSGLSINPDSLVVAKHRLMGEFELQGTSTIKIKGKELSRNDILKLFDQLEDSNDISYHLLIASDKVLLNFLERGEIRYTRNFSITAEKMTPEFIDWISPYFCESFKNSILISFRRQNSEEFVWLTGNSVIWMNKSDQNMAWKGIETELDNMQAKLFEINDAEIHDSGQGTFYANEAVIKVLSILPADQFGSQINKYAWQIMRYASREFNNNNKEWAVEMMGYAKSIASESETKDTIIKKEREMQKWIQDASKWFWLISTKGPNNNYHVRLIFTIIFGLIVGLIIALFIQKL